MSIESNLRRVAHLLRRAGFGGSPDEIRSYAGMDFDQAVDHLVDYDAVANDALEASVADLEETLGTARLPAIQHIWLHRMLSTARPLEEKMTLFWHDHFATANYKVGRPPAMYAQIGLLRANAMADFGTLLRAVSRDPAMLRWLDNNTNRKSSPNENYARELMELFTLGSGNYTELDVREAARAFTGWFFNRDGEFVFNRNQHDFGEKTFLGQTGPWDGDDVLDIILQQPAAAPFIAEKLYRFFVHDHPSSDTIARLADQFRASGYSIRELVRAILHSPDFLSDDAYHGVVKSPAELFIGMMKQFGVREIPKSAPGLLRRMGMDLFNPPNVAGWDWGAGWISSATLLERANAAGLLTAQRGNNQKFGPNPAAIIDALGIRTPDQLVDALAQLLVDGDVSAATRAHLLQYVAHGYSGPTDAFFADPQRTDRAVRGAAHLIMITPVYQMA